ncbi:hypothetical protein Pelo_2376 [Pelomyxa schiedti]|nr:hypothetical protein Pelo_2376 [Pelomyxa schiedti]
MRGVSLLVVACLVFGVVAGDYEATIRSLYTKVVADQMTQNKPFWKPFSWAEQKGIFKSDVLFNFHGPPGLTAVRYALVTPDINEFVTLWVMNALLDAHALGGITLDSTVTSEATTGIVDYKDKNAPTLMRQSFWPQKQENGTWSAYPDNVEGMCEDMLLMGEFVLKVLEDLDALPLLQAITEYMLGMIENFQESFPIPPDFDDSYTNVGFGSILTYLSADFPNAYKTWANANANPESLWEDVVTYSYQPFSADLNLNTIDPRTYYFAHEYLEQLPKDEPFMLPTTWITNIDQSRVDFYKGIVMPFNVNNVDASVAANVLFGLTSQVVLLYPDFSWFTTDLQQLYLNTTNYISWTIESQAFSTRPDIGLLYYPDPYAFLWFVSRTQRLLSELNPDVLAKMPAEVSYAQQRLGTALQGAATEFLISTATNTSDVYWEQWLGAADKDENGEPSPHPDDRLFTTGAAIVDLINIWTDKGTDNKLYWKSSTPSSVKSIVRAAADYVNRTAVSSDALYYNAFFSGSVKGESTLPYAYPANYLEYINGTALPPNPDTDDVTTDLIIGMKGVLSSADYQAMVEEVHFDAFNTPVEFQSYNDVQVFPFWSAEPLTLALDLLALTKVDLLAN